MRTVDVLTSLMWDDGEGKEVLLSLIAKPGNIPTIKT
jgi:hypothetical protein